MSETGAPAGRAVRRVQDAAAALGLAIHVRRFPEGTRTAPDAARAVGCEVGQIVKSLVFMADDRAILALTSGANRADVGKLAFGISPEELLRASGGVPADLREG